MTDRAERPAAPLRAVAFDFDGVILESGPIKQQAFLDLFADHPELQPRILAHHRRHLGVSRYDKLAWIHRELLGRPLSPEELAAAGRRYSELVLEQVLACPLVAGAEELLRALDGRLLSFVVSATPQQELELIVARRGLSDYFRELRGAPGAKADILVDLMRRHRLEPEELVMVGDGLSDYKAARQAGVAFVLRQTAEQEEQFRGVEVERVRDMTDLAAWLDSRLAAGSSQPGLLPRLDWPEEEPIEEPSS
jgi:phosphoglycolate phosphatase-like HAD superfamily hydrolase